MSLCLSSMCLIKPALCLVILFLGFLGYVKKKDVDLLAIGVAFGIFGMIPLLPMMGTCILGSTALLLLKILGYMLVINAIFRKITVTAPAPK